MVQNNGISSLSQDGKIVSFSQLSLAFISE